MAAGSRSRLLAVSPAWILLGAGSGDCGLLIERLRPDATAVATVISDQLSEHTFKLLVSKILRR